MNKQIFGIGGDFFPPQWRRPLLREHLLTLSDKSRPKICYVGTATGDQPQNIATFYQEFGRHDCETSHLSLYNPPQKDIRSYVMKHDIIYVGGGSTKNLMALWKEWNFDEVMREAWEAGIVLSGTSAGSICWFEDCITDSIPEGLTSLKCAGFLKGSNSTHYGSHPDRPSTYRRLIASGQVSNGIATDDHCALHYINDELHEIVTQDRDARAYRVERDGDGYKETVLEARYLG
ncbi:MAG: Type 1 glutamine amidotransferase-like domain-containing protein [Dehalococcoidia bacterium]